jgi:hypothetical protein
MGGDKTGSGAKSSLLSNGVFNVAVRISDVGGFGVRKTCRGEDGQIFEKKIDVDEITDGLDVGKHKAIELFLGFPAEGIGVSVILRTSTSNSSKSIGMALGEVVPSFEITRREFSASQNGYGEPDRNGRCAISAEQLRARMLPDGKAYKIFANDFQRNLSSRETRPESFVEDGLVHPWPNNGEAFVCEPMRGIVINDTAVITFNRDENGLVSRHKQATEQGMAETKKIAVETVMVPANRIKDEMDRLRFDANVVPTLRMYQTNGDTANVVKAIAARKEMLSFCDEADNDMGDWGSKGCGFIKAALSAAFPKAGMPDLTKEFGEGKLDPYLINAYELPKLAALVASSPDLIEKAKELESEAAESKMKIEKGSKVWDAIDISSQNKAMFAELLGGDANAVYVSECVNYPPMNRWACD